MTTPYAAPDSRTSAAPRSDPWRAPEYIATITAAMTHTRLSVVATATTVRAAIEASAAVAGRVRRRATHVPTASRPRSSTTGRVCVVSPDGTAIISAIPRTTRQPPAAQ